MLPLQSRLKYLVYTTQTLARMHVNIQHCYTYIAIRHQEIGDCAGSKRLLDCIQDWCLHRRAGERGYLTPKALRPAANLSNDNNEILIK